MIQLGDFPMTKGSHQHPFRHKSLRGNGKPTMKPMGRSCSIPEATSSVSETLGSKNPKLPYRQSHHWDACWNETSTNRLITSLRVMSCDTTKPNTSTFTLDMCIIYIYLNPTACRVNFQIWMKHRRVKANHAWLLVGKSVNHEIPSLTHIFVGLCWINLG